VSRIAKLGRWFVGALACVLAAGGIEGVVWFCFAYANREARPDLELVLTADSMYAGVIVICLSCAWGIFKWRRWGHILALALFGFHFLIGLLGAVSEGSTVVYPLVAGSVITWLLLPSVRASYWHGQSPQRAAA